MKKQSETAGKWIHRCRKAVKKLIVANVNEVEKVASSVDFVFSAVDMTKDEIQRNRGSVCEDRDTGCLQ